MKLSLHEYSESVRDKTVALLGFGKSNAAMLDFFLSAGAVVSIRDKNGISRESKANELVTEGTVKLYSGEGYLYNIYEDIIVRSPGIKYDVPQLKNAILRGATLTSDVEIFFDTCPCPVYAVTGSDGKTTTTTVISKILEEKHKGSSSKAYLGGNVGIPLFSFIEKLTADDECALELSSFQLQTAHISPECAVITNITPNHLNYHNDMEEYCEAKYNICRNQSHLCRLVVNAENELSHNAIFRSNAFFAVFSSKKTVYPDSKISLTAYLSDGYICINDGSEHKLIKTDEILLPGIHNIENYMAAALALWNRVSPENIVSVARSFKGVDHRCQLVHEHEGVKFYNSSIDSSPTRTIAALNSFKDKVIAIIGGYDKHLDYSPLVPVIKEKVKSCILTGQTGKAIESMLEESGYPQSNAMYIEKFDDAVIIAANAAKSGDTVILTPAAASFDAFKNFEERGLRYCELVRNLK